jgi:CheY-like chemotaxis protein
MSLRILLADESSTIKKAFELGLNSFGAEIKNVQHGIDVLEVAEHFKPDIIFADVLISKMNGYEVCSQIKSHDTLGATPVVLMWSGFMDIDEDKYYTCQADGKIEKPFSADQLMSIIQNLVQKPIGERQNLNLQSQSYFDPEEGTPPPLSQLKATDQKAPVVQSNERPQLKAVQNKPTQKVNPTDDLLFKDDLPPLNNPNFDDLQSTDTDDSETSDDDFGLDGFQALDLHDNDQDSDRVSNFNLDFNSPTTSNPSSSKDSNAGYAYNQNFSDTFEINTDDYLADNLDDESNDNFKEPTQIPTAEEEANLLRKVNEDTNIRHGHGFLNSDLKDELSNPSIDISALAKDLDINSNDNLDSHLLVDYTSSTDLNEDVFGEEMNPENDEFENMFAAEQKNSIDDPNTIHRDVEDLHNSDMGMLSSADDLVDAENSRNKATNTSINSSVDSVAIEIPKAGVQALTKEEIKKIVQEQAKEMIQSIVWELVPEMSKQLIEKEIKRLLADNDTPKS